MEGIEHTKRFFQHLSLLVSLADMNIPADHLEEIAEKATRNGPLGQFKKLYQEDVLNILKLAG